MLSLANQTISRRLCKMFLARTSKTCFILGLTVVFTVLSYEYLNNTVIQPQNEVIRKSELELHKQIVDQFYEKRRYWKTSNLGATLFKNIDSKWFSRPDTQNKTFTVLIWKYYNWLKERHIHNYHSRPSSKLLDECSVKNCVFVGNSSALAYADAVVVQLLRGQIPKVKSRPSHQRWIALSDESANHTFTLAKSKYRPSLSKLANVFNWTMTFRSDSDIPVPYGRTVPLQVPNIEKLHPALDALKRLVPHWDKKRFDIPIAILASNCLRQRMQFYRKLKQHIGIDMHGPCSNQFKHSCPGHFREDCPAMTKYLFYLVLENSKCRQYLTEKIFFHAYAKGAIPIVLGPPKDDCEKLLPPNSYLHMDDYGTPEKLASKIHSILDSRNVYEQLLPYHEWRMHFEVLNEHGYFGTKSVHYCRVCEALNYNDRAESIYDKKELDLFFDPNINCT